MSLVAETKFLCEKYGLKPHRPAGQNFLVNEKIIQDIVAAAEIKKEDIVLEIGAGWGFITKELAIRAKKVYAVELDKRMLKALNTFSKSYKNLKIIAGDVMKVNLNEIVEDKKYKLVANLPYNITSWALRNFLEHQPRPEKIVLLVQKEIGQRIVAGPGDMSLLSVAVQSLSKPEIVRTLSRGNFWPAPEVDSALIRLAPELIQGLGEDSLKPFFRVVKAGFSAKRKKLLNSLSGGLLMDKANISQILSKTGIKQDLRAENLRVEDWVRLYQEFNS